MRTQLLPVDHGSASSRRLDIEGFRITRAWFPADLRIPPHIHDQACLAIMLEGSFQVDFGRTSRECAAGDAVIEPAGEKHGNRIAPAGSHVVVIQPERRRVETVRPLRELIDRIDRVRDPRIVRAAWSLAGEIDDPDPVTSLSAESLALEILATAARVETGRRTARRPPIWLRRVREQLHDRFLERLRIEELALVAGVHPVHLGKVFRACYGRPIASYLRDLRVEWAAARLSASDESLCAIATEAGFSDQSHFTRLFRRRFGITPGRYRRRARA
jgi:AraC family transcriptional regulator